ncbi:MAG: fasciclin domain-containing protein [Bacteroidales bacterium]|nr:fasciclin domain-containing protein [Bacteroidales bacterium]
MIRLWFVIITVPLVILSCNRESEKIFFEEDLVEIADFIINNKDTYSRFYDIMITGEMTNSLNAFNPFGDGFTLFLPTDDAFDRFIQNSKKYSSFNDLLDDIDFVRELGRYHVVNMSLRSNQFPYGALPDTTATGDLLTIGFSSSLDTTIYKVNNVAPVVEINLEMLNGYVHIISEVLEPVNFTGYEWLQENEGFSILAEALKLAGLADTLGLFRHAGNNQLVKNEYTIMAEHDSIFKRYGINSIDDLVAKYATPRKEYTDPQNGFYQFAAYHVLEGAFFLVDFERTGNYNTLGNYPINIITGIEIQINNGVDTFAMEYSETDTTAITYISLMYQSSNVLTKNGAIHFLTEVMELYTGITRSTSRFQFTNDPVISKASGEPGTYEYVDQSEFAVIKWSGPKTLIYFKSSSESEQAWNDDYLTIKGNFVIEYTMPKILPGEYILNIRTNARNAQNATVIVSLDNKRIGGNIDLTRGGASNNPYAEFKIGNVEFVKYTTHTIKIESLIPGILVWDGVQFNPEF